MRTRSLLFLVALLAVVAVVHAWGMEGWPARYDDEGTYVAQAWALEHFGELGHYTYWYDHPPLGWLVMALWTWPTQAFDRAETAIAAGRELMLLVGLLNAGLLYLLARRMGLRRGFALLAVALFALSPLALNYHRMVWLDNLAVPWLLGALVLALTPGHRLWAYGASGVCFGAAVLTKETTLLLAPVLVLALWRNQHPGTRRFCLTVGGVGFVLTAATYPLYALLKSELVPGRGHVSLLEGIGFQLFERRASGSVLDPSSLSHQYVSGWLFLDPWLLGAALVLVPAALVLGRLRFAALALLIQGAVVLRPGYLPSPFVITALPFAALVVAGGADALWGWRPRARARARLAGPVLVAALALVALPTVGLEWARKDRMQMTVNPDVPLVEAQRWLVRHVERDRTLLVDDTLWVDLVEHGFAPERVVWYYKPGSDAAVDRRFPRGWRDFDLVVSSEVMRADRTAQAQAALARSRLIVRFGTGDRRIEIRAVMPA